MEEYIGLFDQFATGAGLSTILSSYAPCRTSFEKVFKTTYATVNYFSDLSDASNANILTSVTAIIKTMSTGSEFASNCLSTVEDSSTSISTYFSSFGTLTDYALAFTINLTSKILNFYTKFQVIMAASSNCDYNAISLNLGIMFKFMYNFEATVTAGSLQPLDITKTKFYEVAEEVFQGLKAFFAHQALLSKESRQ